MKRAVQQIIGRERETATLYKRRPLNSSLRGGGFAPHQLNRSAAEKRSYPLCLYTHSFYISRAALTSPKQKHLHQNQLV